VNFTTSKHGRSARDCKNLIDHLNKPENVFSKILEIGNTAACDLASAVADMVILRNGSSALAALHHITCNPAFVSTEAAILQAAHAMRLELDPDGERPFVILAHGKDRKDPKAAKIHGHLILGNVNGEGRALDDFQSKIRSEVVARTLEHTWAAEGEPCGISRHHAKVVARLRERKLHDVADWMIAHHGENPELPRSAMSAKTRQAAKRQGVELPAAKAKIVECWQRGPEIGAFRSALATENFQIIPGKKDGVWLVVDNNDVQIGALDRLLKLKRAEVRNLMEKENADHGKENRTDFGADGGARPEDFRPIEADFGKNRPAGPTAGAAGSAGIRGGGGSYSPDCRIPGNVGKSEPGTDGSAGKHRLKARYPSGWRARRRVMTRLRAIGWAIARMVARNHSDECPEKRPSLESWYDLWGIPHPK
jgi:hypothetical protein